MLKQLQKSKDQKGFTIIEVLIVLAIAGLILLIVFLAVPALQRNSRNTQRTDDVARVLGAAQEVLNNNNGQLTNLDSAALQSAVGTTLAYYTNTNVTVDATVANAAMTNADNVVLHKGAKCDTTTPGKTVAGSSRQLAVQFAVESAGGTTARCTDS